jgi:hypothetical protein
MEEYRKLGHPYICNYSLNPSLTWVLAMSPQMANIFSNAEYIEVDATFKGSIELEYLFNFVTFDYDSLHSKFIFQYLSLIYYCRGCSCSYSFKQVKC